MDTLRNKDNKKSADFLPVELLGKFFDDYESYHIMSQVFYEFIPNDVKNAAMAVVAERLQFEIKDSK